jgi:hypothetical protein
LGFVGGASFLGSSSLCSSYFCSSFGFSTGLGFGGATTGLAS